MEKKKISLDEFLRLRKLVFRSARPLDYTKWKFLFENGSCDDFLSVLSSYQNEDGGFGHNIECNNWNPKLFSLYGVHCAGLPGSRRGA